VTAVKSGRCGGLVAISLVASVRDFAARGTGGSIRWSLHDCELNETQHLSSLLYLECHPIGDLVFFLLDIPLLRQLTHLLHFSQ